MSVVLNENSNATTLEELSGQFEAYSHANKIQPGRAIWPFLKSILDGLVSAGRAERGEGRNFDGRVSTTYNTIEGE